MERGSKFLAFAFPVTCEDDCLPLLQRIRKEHPKARHYCTALRLHPDASLERMQDDGEPSGSAGRPILGQLVRLQLTNVYVVVVRYFGGTKLGIPGLIEAYKTSTANALEAANIIQKNVLAQVQLTLSYDLFPSFLNFCKQRDIPVIEESFGDQAVLVLGFRKSVSENFLEEALHHFTQLDLPSTADYLQHLGMTSAWFSEDMIR